MILPRIPFALLATLASSGLCSAAPSAPDGFRFESPSALLLLPLVGLLPWFWKRFRAKAPAAILFSGIQIARQASSKSSPEFLPRVLRLAALALTVLALARPQWGTGSVESQSSGIDILLAVDLSASMLGLDMEPTEVTERKYRTGEPLVSRLEAVKQVLSDFIEARPADRIGMIVFARYPYLVSPLTLNHPWLKDQIQRLDVGLIESSTNLSGAMTMAGNRFRELPDAKSRILVLLTDGEHNVKEAIPPPLAAEALGALKVRIYTVAAGTRGQIYTLVPRQSGTGYAEDPNGRPIIDRVMSNYDAEAMRKIAEMTGGVFFESNDREALERAYERIDELEKTKVELRFRTNYAELFHWPALLALLCACSEQILLKTRFRTLP